MMNGFYAAECLIMGREVSPTITSSEAQVFPYVPREERSLPYDFSKFFSLTVTK